MSWHKGSQLSRQTFRFKSDPDITRRLGSSRDDGPWNVLNASVSRVHNLMDGALSS